MPVRSRVAAACLPIIIASMVFLLWAAPAFAGCATDPTAPGCYSTPKPVTPKPATPPPTVAPTAAPTAKPATPKPATAKPRARTTAAPSEQPAETPLPDLAPVVTIDPALAEATPEIVIETPLPTETPDSVAVRAASGGKPQGWAYLLVGMLIAFPAGMIFRGWLARKSRKQAIFG